MTGTFMDPRLVPKVGDGRNEQAPDPQRLTAVGMQTVFACPPSWEPELRSELRFTDRAMAAAAVLMPLIERENGLSLLLTQRTHSLTTHAGQIALPGGRVDASDADVVSAALREAREEVGLPSSHVRVLGTLPEYVTGTAFVVTPVVALVVPGFELRPNPHEVADVFEVPLAFLMDPSNHHRYEAMWRGELRQWYAMPYQDGDVERFIWGATAGMLRNLYRMLVA
jgi:8-oxo-dGTP pyrophosphatase MutT (NUDIX family)